MQTVSNPYLNARQKSKYYLLYKQPQMISIAYMSLTNNNVSPLPKRLREARKVAGLSQRKLGILADIDEFCAGPRVNQYEKGTHTPTFQLVKVFAEKLHVPAHFFYIEDDKVAELALLINKATKEDIDLMIRLPSIHDFIHKESEPLEPSHTHSSE